MINQESYWDIRMSWASAMFFIGSAANAALKLVSSVAQSHSSLISILTGLLIVGSYAMCFKEMLRRSSNIFWTSVIIFFFVYAFSAVLITIQGDPLGQMVKGTAFLTFFWWIPSGVMACSVKDKDVLYRVWVKASYIISFFALLMCFFHSPNEDSTGGYEYNIFFGYCLILPLIIQLNEYLRKKRLWLLLLVLVESVALLLFASRGVILSLIFFVLYKFAFESNSILKRVFALLVIVFSFVVLTSNVQTLAGNAVKVLDVFGVQSRTLELLADGTISETSGREDIWRHCFKMIEERPILGWGLGGEYYEIGHKCYGVSNAEVTASAYHPHNGILQNLVCFGVPIGIIVTLILLLPLLHLKKYKDKNIHDLLVIFASAAVIPICVSSANFFTTPSVAIYFYLYYYGYRKEKKATLVEPVNNCVYA